MSTVEIEQLWQEYFPKVFGYFYRRLNCRQDVEDLASVTMGNFLDRLNRPDSKITDPEGYLWQIAHRQLIDFIRRKSKQPAYVAFDENWQDADESLEQYRSEAYKGRMEALTQCITKHLSGEEYRLVYESIVHDRKSPALATEFNLSSANIRQRLSRALKKVRLACRELWNHYGQVV